MSDLEKQKAELMHELTQTRDDIAQMLEEIGTDEALERLRVFRAKSDEMFAGLTIATRTEK